jgi:hypothetical protein
MRHLQTTELGRLQDTQEGAMMDTCVVLTFAEGVTNEYGKPKPGYQAGSAIECGFNATARKEVMDGAQVAITDAQLRLPIGTTITNLDRLRITHRHGVALTTPLTFAIIGEPRRGSSGLLLNLRSVV